jgi:hypothetical protein
MYIYIYIYIYWQYNTAAAAAATLMERELDTLGATDEHLEATPRILVFEGLELES